ncbi:auxin-responsive protein SAUR78 [Eucalyptus grandis]|uniref:Uncharacterized protein n=2 Tax=Eucalyptus grandis TaxID=71139 RepID=A0ACC3JHP1_EUCGR|nr:auxin-responsive protein SAUR78 [Eucalyptus grandis]KAK3413587.1 hypothetical protein EUGRSUZ_I02135 [Eucalyptus grandis]
MAKMGKLTKLKSAIKRFPSFSKLSRSNSSAAAVAAEDDPRSAAAAAGAGRDVRAVYVGKSRRRYDVSADVFEHPLFQELVDKSSPSSSSSPLSSAAAVVSCEVVLFEHLLWMLENSGDGGAQLGSTDELVEFYTTC